MYARTMSGTLMAQYFSTEISLYFSLKNCNWMLNLLTRVEDNSNLSYLKLTCYRFMRSMGKFMVSHRQ